MFRKIFAFTLIAALSVSAQSASLPLSNLCDLSVDSLPVNFQGHSADDVARQLKRVVTSRDEYESEIKHGERLSQAINTLAPAIANGRLCVVGKNIGLGNTNYEPDSQTLWANIFLNSTSLWFDGKEYRQDFQIFFSERNRKESSYVGSNAFGASIHVSKLERAATYVTFDRKAVSAALFSAGVIEKEKIHLSVPIEITPAEARALHGNVRILYLYKLRPPFLGSYDDFKLPKLDWPFERREKQTLIVAELVGVAVFDWKSGKILKRIEL